MDTIARPDPGRRLSISTTSLPSIRQLHPFLPPATPTFGPSPMSQPQETSFSSFAQASSREAPDTDDDSQPPKKKRRRQALSCTECKRRKIKCDRNQPCAPCSRRGEQSKCVWSNVETADKYVSRVEYDELKARVDHLEALVERLTSTPPPLSSNPAGLYGPYGPAQPPVYHPMLVPNYAGYQPPSRPPMASQEQSPGRRPAPTQHQRIPSSSSGMPGPSSEPRDHPGHQRKRSQDERDRER
ncbi:hypothetical protein C8J56DRAFT_921877 [Mycena floridula]|nr:hypothetical protein C8J56DRAFT_921877 [Mycena floridula]